MKFLQLIKWLIGIMIVLSFCGGIFYFVYMVIIANSIWGSADDWSIEDEPWASVSIPISDKDIEIIYWERHAHPFLAEFERHIELIEDGMEPVIVEIPMNVGGETFINVYSNSNSPETSVLILKDGWGSYILQIEAQELEVDSSGTIPDASQYMGRIEYDQSLKLTFISANDSPETSIESTK
ncbi:MAG TPA: hypothetical protein PK530_13445 [Anaerolineales bacterium]|nr:hypothetical protein [Anaerolineales bacterium]